MEQTKWGYRRNMINGRISFKCPDPVIQDVRPAGVTKNQDGEGNVEELLCQERLTATSPELWPENVKGVVQFVRSLTPPPVSLPIKEKKIVYKKTEVDADEMESIVRLGNLSDQNLMVKARMMCNKALELGLEESYELNRGNLLDIFAQSSKPTAGIHSIKHHREAVIGFTRRRSNQRKKSFISNKKNGHL